MWQLLPEAEGRSLAENAAAIKKALEALPPLVPEILDLAVGINTLPNAGNWDVVLRANFEDLDALQRYQDNAHHLKVAQLIAKLRANRSCVDFQTSSQT